MLFEVKSLSVTLSGMSNDRMGREGGMGVKDIVNTITLPRGNKWRLNDPFVCDLLAIRSAIGVRLKVIYACLFLITCNRLFVYKFFGFRGHYQYFCSNGINKTYTDIRRQGHERLSL